MGWDAYHRLRPAWKDLEEGHSRQREEQGEGTRGKGTYLLGGPKENGTVFRALLATR